MSVDPSDAASREVSALDQFQHIFVSQQGCGLEAPEQRFLSTRQTSQHQLTDDERMSQGSPILVEQIFDIVKDINASGTTVLLVEQNASMALSIADHGYVLETGRVVMDKPAAALLDDDDIKEFYLGLGAEGSAKSFRDVKHYRRRKRWLS